MAASAYNVGAFAGAFVILLLITQLWSLAIRSIVSQPASVVVASGLSLATATVLAGYGLMDGEGPRFAYAFGLYLIPQLVVFLILWLRGRKSKPQFRTGPAAVLNAVPKDTSQTMPDPNARGPRDHPKYRETDMDLIAGNGRASNFFARHWRGELSLGVSYWGVNFLTNLAVWFLTSALTVLFSPEEGFEPASIFWFTFLLWLGLGVLLIWQVVGLWRSARHHAQRQRLANRTVFWAGAAQLAAVLGVLQSVGAFAQNGAPQINELYRMAFEGDPDIPANELKLLSGGDELSVFGGIKYGLSNDVERLLRAAPDVRVVHLTSLGGRIAEAHKLYRILRDRGLDTYVSNECSSACTLVFAAGKQRSLLDGAKLGYHGLSFPGLSGEELRATTEDWAEMYREAGLKSQFVKRALSVPSETMWYPDHDELVQAKVVTSIVTGEGFAISGHEIGPSLESIERDMRAANGVIDALHVASPEIARELYVTTRTGILAEKPSEAMREEVGKIVSKAVLANLIRADDETLAQYAGLLAAQYSALNSKNPALCFRYAAVGTSSEIAAALPSDLVAWELKLNERVLRSAGDRPHFNPDDNEAAWALIGASMTPEEFEVFAIEPSNVDPEQYAQYCRAAIAMFTGMRDFGPAQAAMLMRQMFSNR